MERRLREDNPVIYKNLTFGDIDSEHLVLNLSLAVKPVDRAATVRKIYFQDIRVNNLPVRVEPFEEEFKLSKKDVVDLPKPLKCTIIFSDLDSFTPLQEMVNEEQARITGQTFLEVKLNPLEKIATRAGRVVVPVEVSEKVPLQMFSDNPLLKLAASEILKMLADPSSAAAVALAKEHLAKLDLDRKVSSLGESSLYLIYCEFALRDPKTGVTEKFTQSGTGFLVSPEGKVLTSKRVIEPWKFDPQAAFQQDKQTLKVLKTAPDQMEKVDYADPDSGEKATLDLHASGANDLALLELSGSEFRPLPWAESGSTPANAGQKLALMGFPYGLSQPKLVPKTDWVHATSQSSLFKLGRALNPGESGAPLVTTEGKVAALCAGPEVCIPIEIAQALIQ